MVSLHFLFFIHPRHFYLGGNFFLHSSFGLGKGQKEPAVCTSRGAPQRFGAPFANLFGPGPAIDRRAAVKTVMTGGFRGNGGSRSACGFSSTAFPAFSCDLGCGARGVEKLLGGPMEGWQMGVRDFIGGVWGGLDARDWVF